MSDISIHRPCPVCSSDHHDPQWRKGELRLVCCRVCGMVYVNPVPAGMASGQFYDTEGAEYYLSPAKLESDYAEVRFARELRLFRKHCERGAVLDMGCSSGAFLFQLKKHWPGDYEILGTDASGAPLDYAESRGVPVVRGTFLELDFRDCSRRRQEAEVQLPQSDRLLTSAATTSGFDAITFWAVMEHLAEPKRFLEKAHAILKPGGLCFVLVPNFRSLAVRLLGAQYRYVYPQHLNYFTTQTLARLVAPRFEVVETRFTHFNPIVIWQDWRGGGREVSNQERGALLQRTTAYKQRAGMKPVKWIYKLTERTLATFGLADNLAVVLKKRT